MTNVVNLDEKQAAREAKIRKDRERRVLIKAVDAACEKAGIDARYKDLSPEQRNRAATYEAGHAGLSGNALGEFILSGKTIREQSADAKAKRAEASKAAQRQSTPKAKAPRAANDPEASALTERAWAAIWDGEGERPFVKGTLVPGFAREYLDNFEPIERDDENHASITVVRKGAEPVVVGRNALEAYAISGVRDEEIGTQMRVLGKGLYIGGRKLASLILGAAS